MKKIFTLLFCFALVGTYAQVTVLLTPVQYNTIYEDTDNSNGNGLFLFAGRTNPGGGSLARRGLLLFDLSGIPPGSTITDVNLSMFMSQTVAGAESVNLHNVLQPWGQGTSVAPGGEGQGAPSTLDDANWLCAFSDGAGGCNVPWPAGGDFDPAITASQVVAGQATYIWAAAINPGMVSTVQNWLDNPGANFGWIVIGNEAAFPTAKRFNAVGDDEPVLEVTYDAPMSVVKNDFSDLITTYPNPTSGSVTVDFEKTYSSIRVKITDMSGQIVSGYTENSVNKLNVNLDGAPGIYFIELVSDKGKRAVLKMVKK